ncbi:MAG: diguanylate cyclase [Actinomycetota bacterium]|nr:diguanylate cyclase [Actinomycetota bacterium]
MNILLVEDSPADADLIRDLIELAPGADVSFHWVQTLTDARLALGDRPDCVLLDLGLPDARGLEGVQALLGQCPDIPVVVLTGRDDQEFALQAVASGAQDYVSKTGMDGEAILRAARYAVQRQRSDNFLATKSFEDPLTGLGNRAVLSDRLALSLSRRRRAESPVALLLLDLDDFTAVNDGHGHRAGDRLLVEVADCLRGALRPEDTAARLSDDQFALLCEDVRDADAAAVVAERLVEAVRRLSRTDIAVSASLGVALSGPASAAESMLADAGAAMDEAKRSGKDRWVLQASSPPPKAG